MPVSLPRSQRRHDGGGTVAVASAWWPVTEERREFDPRIATAKATREVEINGRYASPRGA